jgi:hypothetical protein
LEPASTYNSLETRARANNTATYHNIIAITFSFFATFLIDNNLTFASLLRAVCHSGAGLARWRRRQHRRDAGIDSDVRRRCCFDIGRFDLAYAQANAAAIVFPHASRIVVSASRSGALTNQTSTSQNNNHDYFQRTYSFVK